MDSEIENLKFEIKGALFQLTSDQLMQISDCLEISGTNQENIAGKTRNALVSHIIAHVERNELTELEDEGMSELLSLLDTIRTLQEINRNDKSEQAKENDEQEKLKRELEQLKLMVQQKEIEVPELANKNRESVVNNKSEPIYTAPANTNNSPW